MTVSKQDLAKIRRDTTLLCPFSHQSSVIRFELQAFANNLEIICVAFAVSLLDISNK
jgi:hypothetical protein